MKRVPIEELELVEDSAYCHGGVPFTGIIYEAGEKGIAAELAVKDGLMHGLMKIWYPSGLRMAERMYAKHSLHGESLEWYKTGGLRERAVYEFAICLERTIWDEAGQIVSRYLLTEADPNYKLLQLSRRAHSREK
jgi:antitoxin component YwqK of YwqJK toxin-antitoxin module